MSPQDDTLAVPDAPPDPTPVIARLLKTMLLCAAALAAVWAAAWIQAGRPLPALAGVAVLLLLHPAVLGLEFVLASRIGRNDTGRGTRPIDRWRAWAGEVAAAAAVFGWRQPFLSRKRSDHLPAEARGRRGLVLVHGFFCNRGLWLRWQARLIELGVPHVAVDLEPPFDSIDAYVPVIDAAVRRVHAATGLAPVIVGHSMGGLASRRWWVEPGNDDRLHHLITIGSPHGGTWLARWAYSRNGREMQLASAWLQALKAREPAGRAARITCFWSECDNIVFPPSTARLPGATAHHLPATGHVQMADRPEPYAEALSRLGVPESTTKAAPR